MRMTAEVHPQKVEKFAFTGQKEFIDWGVTKGAEKNSGGPAPKTPLTSRAKTTDLL